MMPPQDDSPSNNLLSGNRFDRSFSPLEVQPPFADVNDYRIAVTEIAAQQVHSQRLHDLALDHPAKRPRAIDGIEAFLSQQLLRRGGQLQLDMAFGQPLPQ